LESDKNGLYHAPSACSIKLAAISCYSDTNSFIEKQSGKNVSTIGNLRERKEDIPALVNYFVDRYAERAGRKIRGIRKRALDLLESYSWPGNIRELQNVIERSLIVCETDQFTIDKSWLSGGPMPTRSRYQASMEAPVPGERESIEAALAQTKGKVSGSSGAAAKLGIPASTLESKIRSLKFTPASCLGSSLPG
jgi:transcriptional regulator with PAS, ATPase and Fis domain